MHWLLDIIIKGNQYKPFAAVFWRKLWSSSRSQMLDLREQILILENNGYTYRGLVYQNDLPWERVHRLSRNLLLWEQYFCRASPLQEKWCIGKQIEIKTPFLDCGKSAKWINSHKNLSMWSRRQLDAKRFIYFPYVFVCNFGGAVSFEKRRFTFTRVRFYRKNWL